MRRIVALAGIAGIVVVGLGCKHVGGTCDCGYNPASTVIHPPGQPYAAHGQPIPAAAVPEVMPMPGDAPMGR